MPTGYMPGTSQPGNLALKDMWDAEIKSHPYEESVICALLDRPNGVEKAGNQLWVRILPRFTAQTLTGTQEGTTLNYFAGAVERVAIVPVFSYSAAQVPDHLTSKLTSADSGNLLAGFRRGMMKAVQAAFDVDAGTLGTGFSNALGLPSNLDQSMLLAGKGLLVTNAKEFVNFNSGSPNINLVYHPSQMQYVDAIVGIMHAYARGDKSNPTVSGVVHDAWGLHLVETGNIYTAAGVAYNMLFTKEAGVAAYNLEVKMKDPQQFEAVTRYICEGEAGFDEQFDEAGVTFRTPV